MDLEVTHLAYDSRRVSEQGLFTAIVGHKTDGHQFIDQALQKGVRVIVTEREDYPVPSSVTRIRVKNSREALSQLAACFYGYPASNLRLVGITGTNGKTTTSYLIESILKTAGFSVGVLGTIYYRYGSKIQTASMTTPESLDLQGLLAEMVRDGVTHVVMEVSSHALDQGRLREIAFDQAVFTNLSQDHLDYHLDMEDYFQAKTKLFTHHLKSGGEGIAIINCDDPYGQRIWEARKGPKQDYRLEKSAAYFPLEIHSGLNGVSGRIKTPHGTYSITSPLIGHYNMSNILAAWAVGEGFKLAGQTIQKGIEALASVPGRMEPVPNNLGLTILVDYSHTPEALRSALLSIKRHGQGKILTVFGCGGDRDPHKRPLMGKVAGELSDLTVVTSDNPRTENPLTIITQIEEGLKNLPLPVFNGEPLREIPDSPGYVLKPDRREAIALAISLAQTGDVVLIAGKGHETYQLLGRETIHFDDREETRKALEALNV